MENYSKKLVRGTVIIILSFFISAIIGYAIKLMFARSISVSDIGLFYSVLGFVTFFAFLRDFGLSDSLIYFIPRFIVENSKKKIKSAILLALGIQIIFGMFFFILVFISSEFLSLNYFKDENAKFLLLSLSVYFIIDGVNEVLFRSFQGHQNMALAESVDVTFQVSSLFFFILIIFFKMPIKFFGLSYTASSLIVAIIFSVVFLKKVFPGFLKEKAELNTKFRDEIIGYSIPGMMGSLAANIFSQQSIFFLTLFTGLESVGLYVMAMSLAKVSIYISKAISRVFPPMTAELWKRKEMLKLNSLYNEIISFSHIVSVPIAIVLIIFSKEIITLLFGEKFMPAYIILKIYAVYYLIFNFEGIIKGIFLMIGEPKTARNITYLTLAVNFILNLVLIPSYGLIGAAIADITSVFVALVYSVYLQYKITKLGLPVKGLLGILISSSFVILVLLALKDNINLSIILKLIVLIIISGLVYLVSLFYLKLLSFDKINNLLKLMTNSKIKLPFYKEALKEDKSQ